MTSYQTSYDWTLVSMIPMLWSMSNKKTRERKKTSTYKRRYISADRPVKTS
jgi:hypothetical protein